jgi:hypothetical protein
MRCWLKQGEEQTMKAAKAVKKAVINDFRSFPIFPPLLGYLIYEVDDRVDLCAYFFFELAHSAL